MAQTNSRRVSHDIDVKNSPWRGDDLQQIIDDITEGLVGPCFEEVQYITNTNFVTKQVTYSDPTKTKKRAESNFSYLNGNPPFISSIVTDIYNEEDGTTIIATVTETVVYNSNKTVQSINTNIVRV